MATRRAPDAPASTIRDGDRVTLATEVRGLLHLAVTNTTPDRSMPGVVYVGGYEIGADGQPCTNRPCAWAVSGAADGTGLIPGGSVAWSWYIPQHEGAPHA